MQFRLFFRNDKETDGKLEEGKTKFGSHEGANGKLIPADEAEISDKTPSTRLTEEDTRSALFEGNEGQINPTGEFCKAYFSLFRWTVRN